MAAAPTLADVAREAGVSTFTASMALRGSAKVAPATRERVLAAAAAIGYRTNPLVRTVMAGIRHRQHRLTGNVIAFLVTRERANRPHQLDYQDRLRKGAEVRARHYGFRLESIHFSSASGSGRRLQQVLDARGIVGVMVPPVPNNDFAFGLEWERLACVAIGHSFAEVPTHRVSSNHARFMRTALKACANLGWSRPGLAVSNRLVEATDEAVVGGYFGSTYLTGGNFAIPPYLYDDDDFYEPGFLDWVRREEVGVVLTMRGSLYDTLRDAGYEIGRDIGYAMLNWHSGDARFAGIDQHMPELGAAAIDLLVQVMQANEFGIPSLPRIVELDGDWVDGPSLPRR
jgi:hypothetical protein